MMSAWKIVASGTALVVLFGAAVAPEAPLGLGMLPEAQAVVGAPLTPVSAAGVARRTTRRAVVATSAATPDTVVVQSAPAPATSGALPIGTVVPALPGGCSQLTMSGVEYYKCGPDYYRTAYQGTNLVYVTAQP
ncbi:MAG: hypothetical protein MUC71_11800 [Steroidobacteraceae bacterium]|jgi:hypothetical protein|nr:hypothetical protein [Steroidobacteraceae bacterium]